MSAPAAPGDLELDALRKPCNYICASCMYEVAIEGEGRLICPRCASLKGSSCIFYKKREQSTTYDTV